MLKNKKEPAATLESLCPNQYICLLCAADVQSISGDRQRRRGQSQEVVELAVFRKPRSIGANLTG